MRSKLVAIVCVVVGLVLLLLSVAQATSGGSGPVPPPTLPAGHDAARPGATLENGWAVANIGPCTFLDFYQRAWNVLGQPVSSFDGSRQAFEYGQLICQPDSPAGQQIALANLGYTELRSTGHLPQPNAPVDPVVQDFLGLSLERGGIDPAVFFGAPISAPSCDRSGTCVQYLEKTRVSWPQGAMSGEAVTRAPLGLWQRYPETRPEYLRAKQQAAERTAIRWPLLVGGVASLAIGVMAAVRSRRRHGVGTATI